VLGVLGVMAWDAAPGEPHRRPGLLDIMIHELRGIRGQSLDKEDSPRLSDTLPIPAAQYVRMSTEDQQYSIANQRIRLQEYARNHGFNIIKTYEFLSANAPPLLRRAI
jgi:Resolvase, N terminal domain